MSNSELALACAGMTLQVFLLVVLLRGAHQKSFPGFCTFTLYSIATTVTAFVVGNSRVYFWFYWISEFLNTLIVFLVLHEIFKTLFRSFYRMLWFRLLFPGIGTLMLCLAALRAISRPMPPGNQVFAVIVSLEVAVGFLQIGTFCLFLVLIQFFRVSPRQRAFGLALGFGILAAGSLVVYLLRSEFGTKLDPVVRVATPIAYTLALVVWLVTFLVKEPAPAQTGVTTGLTPEQMISDVKRYTEAAKRIFRH